MDRSRVYCTHPANANRRHNAKTARAIPRKASFRGRPSRGWAYVPAYSLPDRAAVCPPRGRDLGR